MVESRLTQVSRFSMHAEGGVGRIETAVQITTVPNVEMLGLKQRVSPDRCG